MKTILKRLMINDVKEAIDLRIEQYAESSPVYDLDTKCFINFEIFYLFYCYSAY